MLEKMFKFENYKNDNTRRCPTSVSSISYKNKKTYVRGRPFCLKHDKMCVSLSMCLSVNVGMNRDFEMFKLLGMGSVCQVKNKLGC